jgi:hypothetical protein
MDMFNKGNVKKDEYWDHKAAQMMTECIRLLRATLGYCSLGLVHRVVTDTSFLSKLIKLYNEKMEVQRLYQKIVKPNLRNTVSLIIAIQLRSKALLKEMLRDICYEDVVALSYEIQYMSDEELLDDKYMLLLARLHDVASVLFIEKLWDMIKMAKSHLNINLLDFNPFSMKEAAWFWDEYLRKFSEQGYRYLSKFMKEIPPLSEFDYNTCTTFFSGEFDSKAETTIETIKTVVTQMTFFFVSSERIAATFSPPEEEVTFLGFEEAIKEGKIVVLAMNVAQYPQASRTVAAYLKQDFQSEVQQRTSPESTLGRERPVFFICDEYQEFVTSNDGNFYGVSREARCCSIVASQSYTSILKALGGDKPAFETLVQNMISKIVLRSDDMLTIESIQKLTGKIDKTKQSRNISESAADSHMSGITGGLMSNRTSVSESISLSTHKEALFEERDFTQVLEVFKAIVFLASPNGMQPPTMAHLLPAFREPILSLGKDVAL